MNRCARALALGTSLLLASTLAAAALTPLSDAELSERHAEGLSLLELGQLAQSRGAAGIDMAAWQQSQDLLKSLERQQSQGQQRLAMANLQTVASSVQTLSLAGTVTSFALAPLLLPVMGLPALNALTSLLPPKADSSAKPQTPKGP